MLTQLKRILIGLGVLMLIVSACQSIEPVTPISPPTTDHSAEETLAALIATLTGQPLTQSAVTEAALQNLTATLLPSSEVTSLPGNPPTIIVTPLVSVSSATNCRTGPGESYEIVGVVEPGIKFAVIGKYTSQNTWIIKLTESHVCWLWGGFATVDGNVNNLPEFVPPPTPIPLVGSIRVTVRGPSRNGDNNALLTDAMVEIRALDLTAENLHDGRYLLENILPGEKYVFAESPEHGVESISVIVIAGQLKEPTIHLGWTLLSLQLCAALPTVGQRVKCYLDLEAQQVPTTLPPQQLPTATPTPFQCPPLRPNCQPAPTQGPGN